VSGESFVATAEAGTTEQVVAKQVRLRCSRRWSEGISFFFHAVVAYEPVGGERSKRTKRKSEADRRKRWRGEEGRKLIRK